MNTGNQTVYDDLHDKDHINVLKFANTHPNLFVTSSFDHYVKMWDLRTDIKSKKPVYRYAIVHICTNIEIYFQSYQSYLCLSNNTLPPSFSLPPLFFLNYLVKGLKMGL